MKLSAYFKEHPQERAAKAMWEKLLNSFDERIRLVAQNWEYEDLLQYGLTHQAQTGTLLSLLYPALGKPHEAVSDETSEKEEETDEHKKKHGGEHAAHESESIKEEQKKEKPEETVGQKAVKEIKNLGAEVTHESKVGDLVETLKNTHGWQADAATINYVAEAVDTAKEDEKKIKKPVPVEKPQQPSEPSLGQKAAAEIKDLGVTLTEKSKTGDLMQTLQEQHGWKVDAPTINYIQSAVETVREISQQEKKESYSPVQHKAQTLPPSPSPATEKAQSLEKQAVGAKAREELSQLGEKVTKTTDFDQLIQRLTQKHGWQNDEQTRDFVKTGIETLPKIPTPALEKGQTIQQQKQDAPTPAIHKAEQKKESPPSQQPNPKTPPAQPPVVHQQKSPNPAIHHTAPSQPIQHTQPHQTQQHAKPVPHPPVMPPKLPKAPPPPAINPMPPVIMTTMIMNPPFPERRTPLSPPPQQRNPEVNGRRNDANNTPSNQPNNRNRGKGSGLPIPPGLASNLAKLAITNWWIIAIIAAVLLAFLIIVFFAGIAGDGPGIFTSFTGGNPAWERFTTGTAPTPAAGTTTPIPGLTIRKTGPSRVDNGQDITYTLTVEYEGSQEITIVDPIPANTSFIGATGTFQQAGNQVRWPLMNNTPKTTVGNKKEYSFSLTLHPTRNDIKVENKAHGEAQGGRLDSPLTISESVDKTTTTVSETLTFTVKVAATSLAGNTVTVTADIPKKATFLSADGGGVQKGDTVEWTFDAVKGDAGTRIIPPEKGPAPAGVGRSVQRVTATVEQLKADIEQYSRDPSIKAQAQHVAEVLYKSGSSQNPPVDPAFLAAIWFMETAYGANGAYPNNPFSISFISEGALGGMKKGPTNQYSTWATWDTFDQGLSAMALNVATRYYPNGQTDTWTIHSGKDENDTPQFHCRCHIGVGDPEKNQIRTWNDFVNFFYKYHTVMDRITGGNNSHLPEKTLTFSVRPNTDKTWLVAKAKAFSPGTGDVHADPLVIKVGDAPESERPVLDGSVAGVCADTPVSFGAEKKLLPLPNDAPVCARTITGTCGRPGLCIRPKKIVLHTTAGPLDALGTWQFFANGSPQQVGYAGVASHFIIGKDGTAIQAVEMYKNTIDVAYAVENYADHISIEMTHADKNAIPKDTYSSKTAVPPAQYQATFDLVKKLMQQYSIPLGNLEYDWKAPSNQRTDLATPGLYGHYQLNPNGRADPGAGLMRDIREDLRAGGFSAPSPTPSSAPPSPSTGPVAQKTFNLGNPTLKRIAITLDYGQGKYGKGERLSDEDRRIMHQILDTFAAHNTKITIFATGAFYADPQNADILQKMKNAGHEFANHTFDHASADDMSATRFIQQLAQTEEAAQKAVGKTTKPYFRYPFLADKPYLDILAQQGYYYIRMTCDGGDWREGWTATRVLTQMKSNDCKKNGSIIIVHGYTPQTAGALDAVLNDYEQSGYETTTVTRVLEGLIP